MSVHSDAHHYRPGLNPAFLEKAKERFHNKAVEAARKAGEAKRRAAEQRLADAEAARIAAIEARACADIDHAVAQAEAQQRAFERLAAKSLSPREIIAAVAIANGFLPEDLTSRSRATKLVRVRQEAMWEIKRRKPAMSTPQIGRLFNRDHTTVIHAIKRVESRRTP